MDWILNLLGFDTLKDNYIELSAIVAVMIAFLNRYGMRVVLFISKEMKDKKMQALFKLISQAVHEAEEAWKDGKITPEERKKFCDDLLKAYEKEADIKLKWFPRNVIEVVIETIVKKLEPSGLKREAVDN